MKAAGQMSDKVMDVLVVPQHLQVIQLALICFTSMYHFGHPSIDAFHFPLVDLLKFRLMVD